MIRSSSLLAAGLMLGLGAPLTASVAQMEEIEMRPCITVASDVGDTARERQQQTRVYAEHIAETSKFFMRAFDIDPKAFVEYAELYHNPPENPYDANIRIRIFQRRDEFLKDFQTRYETETIPGAFFGIIRPKDEYGQPTGPWFREIGAYAEGQPLESVLRSLYHEMGHLFMRTYMLYPLEVPSWIEEGTAELFQYRVGNGTDPMPVRVERLGELYEMVHLEPGAIGASIPWDDFTQVRNAHNLDFTHLDPLRSQVQYAQAWSVLEFMIGLDLQGDLEDRRRAQAFTKLLKLFKRRALELNQQAGQRDLSGERRRAFLNENIYQDQYDLIKQCYGRDVLTVEDLWRKTIARHFDENLERHPELLYHRGAFHLESRSRFLEGAEREAALATAEALFREAIERFPDHPTGYVGMGRLALDRDAVEDAGEWFGKATERGSESFEVLLYGGIALLESGKAAEAAASLATAVEQRPTHVHANVRYAQALATATDSDDERRTALQHLDTARTLSPDDRAWPSLLAGVIHYDLGDFHQAHINLLRAQGGMPNHYLPPLMIAVVKHANVEIEDAQAWLRQAAAISKEGADRLGRMFEQDGASLGFAADGTPGIHGLTIPPPDADD